jgi:VWFA-related protein
MVSSHPVASFVLAGLLLSAPGAGGQDPATPASASQSTAAANPASTSTVLHANANLVLVDVVVTDRDKPVHGLDKSRFRVFEDGHEQAIASFDEHRAPDAGPAGALPAMKRAALPPSTYTNIPDYPAMGAVSVLLLDGLNTPLTDQMNVRLKMIQYLGKIKPGTSLAIFGLSTQLRMIAGFSTDLAALSKALKSPRTTRQQSTVLDSETTALAEDMSGTTKGPLVALPTQGAIGSSGTVPSGWLNGGPMDVAAAAQVFMADVASFQADQRAAMTLDAMQQLARYLSAIPGRKNVIWFSGSFPSWTPPDNSVGFRAESNRMERVRETTKILSDARISIYPVDARGLMVSSVFSAANNHPPVGNTYAPLTSMTPFAAQLHIEMEQRVAEQATMQQIAQDTGGKAFVDTNDFGDAVADVVENGSSYYTIGYVPSRKAFDGQFHAFRVRLDDASYKLAYRSGYYADDPDKPSEHHPGETRPIVAASMQGAPLATQISFVARVLPASNPLLQGAALTKSPVGNLAATVKGPVHRYVVDLVLDMHGLVFRTAADGNHVANMEFALVAYDEEGTRLNYLEHGIQLALRPDLFPKLIVSGVPIRAELDLPEGQGSLRIAIHDLASGRAGSLEVPVTVTSQ